jgi:peptidoglycan/xylan/chitin deacetylase (PgdA/CDA1 family)
MPYGRLSVARLLIPRLLGLANIFWSINPEDYSVQSADELLRNFDRCDIQNGDIILLHDNVSYTAQALPAIIERIRCMGFSFETVAEIMKRS